MNLAPIDATEDLEVDAKVRAFVEATVEPSPPGEGAALREQVVRRMEAVRAETIARGRRRRQRQAWAVFASAACAPVIAWALWPARGATARAAGTAILTDLAGHARIQGDEVQTGPGDAARATLATGAVVDLSGSSRVRFASESGVGGVGDRVELAAGRIQVTVPKLGPGRDLRVRTEEATVVVHGTKFAVLSEKGATHVSVTEGLVEVDTTAGVRMLSAGMSLAVPAEPAPSAAILASPPAVATEPIAPRPGGVAASTLAAENALLAEAMRLRHERRAARAAEQLDELLARYPSSPLVETAKVERLRALEDSGAYARLGREAQAYLDDYPRGFARAEASQMLDGARAHTP